MGFSLDERTNLLEMQSIVHYDKINEQGRGGARHISAILPAVSSALGVPVSTIIHPDPAEAQKQLGIPDVESAIVVVVDGLGFWNVVERKGHAPYLRSLLNRNNNDRPISSCFPSTTATSLSVFGTGTCPGMTAMTGYSQINPATDELCQMIQFTGGLIPEVVQKQPTIFEQLSERGMRVTTSGLANFKNSMLTRAALRGTRYVSGSTPGKRIAAAAKASYTPGLTYVYIRDADKMGHKYGWDDEHWIGAFEHVDWQLKTLAEKSAPGTLIIVTADHGMINSNPESRIDIAEHCELSQGIKLVGGEPRVVSLYASDGEDPDNIAQRWRDFLGDKALIYTKEEAISRGMYGVVLDTTIPYLGDVIAVACSDTTIVDSRTQSDMATRLPSVHGSMTQAELDIPFFVDIL